MKQFFVLFLAAGLLAACNNEGGNEQDPVDSLEKRVDTLKENIDSTTDAKIDSLQERAQELKEKFDSSAEARKDSIQKNDQ